MDKYISSFLDEFEEADDKQEVSKDVIDHFQDKLPTNLIGYWKELGFGQYLDGMFWLVNPLDYSNALQIWIDSSPLKDIDDNLHVIARSGFGDLYIWGEKNGYCYDINALNCWIIKKDHNNDDLEKSIQLFIASKSPETIDLEDEDSDEELHELAVEKLGTLKNDEIYAFSPALVAGGPTSFDNLTKANMIIHYNLLVEMKKPEIVTKEDLIKLAFG